MTDTSFIERQLTSLADDQLKDPDIRAELINKINQDRRLKFLYDVQFVISKLIKQYFIMYPAPNPLRNKIISILNEESS